MERGNSLPLLSSLCTGRESLAILTHNDASFLSPRALESTFFFPCFPFSHKRVKCSPSFPSSLSEVKRDSFACYFLQTLTVLVFCFNISGWELFFFFASSECSFLSYKNMKPDTHFKFGYWQLWSKYNCIHLVLLSLLLSAN